jgi:hypothetical protein
LRHTSISYPLSGTMPGDMRRHLHKALRLLTGEEQRLCGDTNCQRKSITLPVTVVLELAASSETAPALAQNPRQMNFFPERTSKLRLPYMYFSKQG